MIAFVGKATAWVDDDLFHLACYWPLRISEENRRNTDETLARLFDNGEPLLQVVRITTAIGWKWQKKRLGSRVPSRFIALGK